MPAIKTINRYCIYTFVSLTLNCAFCIAQKIKLKDVAKIEFLYRMGGMSSDGRLIDVVPENNNWNSYQTRLVVGWDFKKKQQINDSSRTFIRSISPNVLEQLLYLIAKPDKDTNPILFDIHKDELVKYIDAVVPALKPMQKAEFAETLQYDSAVNKMLIRVTHPGMWDDRSYYGITITTKKHKTYKAYALSFANAYYLPWIINKKNSFNPHIAEIFEYVGGNDKYADQEKQKLYKFIILFANLTYFQPRFSWDDFREEEPTLYTAMKGSFIPISFFRYKKGESGTFLSSRLPPYVQLDLGFLKGDVAAIEQYKRQEDSLIKIFKANNFLFTYIKSKPGCIVRISPKEMVSNGEFTFKNIKKYYPEIDGVDYKQSYLLEVVESTDDKTNDTKESKWLILPNSKIILLYYTGTLKIGSDEKFKGIISTNKGANTACFVFDRSGKKIAGVDGPVDI